MKWDADVNCLNLSVVASISVKPKLKVTHLVNSYYAYNKGYLSVVGTNTIISLHVN